MPVMKSLAKQYNQMEPQSFIDAFRKNLPEDFETETICQNIPELCGFSANFDLLTTLDESMTKTVDKLRSINLFSFISRKFLCPETTFIGTTVSEYALFPKNIQPQELITAIKNYLKETDKKYLIIKDIPFASPLLTKEENDFTNEFVSYLEDSGFQTIVGQALAYLPVNFKSMEDYFSRFSHKRRYDFRRKIKAFGETIIEEFDTGDSFFTDETVKKLYSLYLNVFDNSRMTFDKLTLEFFKQVFQDTKDGKVFIYSNKGKIIAFNLCFISNNKFLDKYRGCIYPDSHKYHLYSNQFFHNLDYCIKNNLDTFVMGCAAAKTKAYLGCKFTFTRHAVYIKNPLARYMLKQLKHYFEFDNNLLN